MSDTDSASTDAQSGSAGLGRVEGINDPTSPESSQQHQRQQAVQRPEALTAAFLSMIDEPSLHVIFASQAEMLERFERANHMLTNFNDLSLGRFRQLSAEFRQHQQTLDELRKDIELVFKRINNIKRLTERQHPEHFAAAVAAVGDAPTLSQAASECDLASASLSTPTSPAQTALWSPLTGGSHATHS